MFPTASSLLIPLGPRRPSEQDSGLGDDTARREVARDGFDGSLWRNKEREGTWTGIDEKGGRMDESGGRTEERRIDDKGGKIDEGGGRID